MLDQYAPVHQHFDGTFYRGFADGQAKLHHVALCELSNLLIRGASDDFDRRELFADKVHPVLKVSVCCQDRRSKYLMNGAGSS